MVVVIGSLKDSEICKERSWAADRLDVNASYLIDSRCQISHSEVTATASTSSRPRVTTNVEVSSIVSGFVERVFTYVDNIIR